MADERTAVQRELDKLRVHEPALARSWERVGEVLDAFAREMLANRTRWLDGMRENKDPRDG